MKHRQLAATMKKPFIKSYSKHAVQDAGGGFV